MKSIRTPLGLGLLTGFLGLVLLKNVFGCWIPSGADDSTSHWPLIVSGLLTLLCLTSVISIFKRSQFSWFTIVGTLIVLGFILILDNGVQHPELRTSLIIIVLGFLLYLWKERKLFKPPFNLE